MKRKSMIVFTVMLLLALAVCAFVACNDSGKPSEPNAPNDTNEPNTPNDGVCEHTFADGSCICTKCQIAVHSYAEEFTVDIQPTCTTPGNKSRHCLRCGDRTEPTEILPLGHDEIPHNGQAATCTVDGWNDYVTCSRCDYTTYSEINALGHKFDLEFTVDEEATCTKDGSKSRHCLNCGDKIEVTTIAKLGHIIVSHGAQEATCTTVGWNAYEECTRDGCGHTTYVEIPAGHGLISHSAKAATCTEVGWNAYDTCSRCDYTTYEEIGALGHDYATEFTVDTAATCTTDGSKSKHCSRCEDKSEVTVINKLGHDITHHGAQAATCTGIGWSAYDDCSRCDYTTYEEIGALGHDYETEFTVDIAATCVKVGSKSKHCSRCESQIEVTEIPLSDSHNVDENCQCADCLKYIHMTKGYCRHTDEKGEFIYFGSYPQTIKSNKVTVSMNPGMDGYYKGSDGERYTAVVAVEPVNGTGYKFSDGKKVETGKTYYFKVEPIKWRILEEDGETAFIICDMIIDNKKYAESSNNYANSAIRAWLNNEFLNKAFNGLQQELINITNVDNSARSTNPEANATAWGSGNNQYACDNTEDKVFLLSAQEVTNSAYGFSDDYSSYASGDDPARKKITSDFVRATGIWMTYNSDGEDYGGTAEWWLRSPLSFNAKRAHQVRANGSADCVGNVDKDYIGVVPALKIRLV